MELQTKQTLAYALEYFDAGLVPIPVKLDGSKSPALKGWKAYQMIRPKRSEVEGWFLRPSGIAVLMGSISGGAECLDFDDSSCCWPILSTIDRSLLIKLAVYETPKGGWHVVYRCQEIYGAVKLARRADKSTRIETRGENSYIIAEGSPLSVHAAGLPYCHYSGCRLEALNEITPSERNMLWQRAAEFDETGEPTPAQKLGRMQAEEEYRQFFRKPMQSIDQARSYLATMAPAVQGADGSSKCFRVACKLVSHFGLNRDEALRLMIAEYNPRCSPPWSLRELEHKVDDAINRTCLNRESRC